MVDIKKCFMVTGSALVSIALDQATKKFALGFLMEDKNVSVVPGFFDLTLRHNTGAAFSLFATKPTIFFLMISAIAVGTLLYFVWHLERDQKEQLIALGAVLGGALGNLLDRIRMGSVVDFLLFHYKALSWPAFNVADTMIVVGVFVFLWYNLRQGKEENNRKGR